MYTVKIRCSHWLNKELMANSKAGRGLCRKVRENSEIRKGRIMGRLGGKQDKQAVLKRVPSHVVVYTLI